MRASDIEALDELSKQLIFHIDSWQRRHKHLRFFFVTLMSDEFRSSKRKPEIWLKSLKRKADKTLRDVGLEGVAMIEVAALLNPPDTLRPEVHFHVHAVCWTDKNFDLKAARAALETTRGWTNCWGIPPIHIRELTAKKGVAARWAGYMSKHPVDALNVDQSNGSQKLRRTKDGFRPDFRLRLIEGLSQIALRDLVFSVGEGKDVRDPVMRNVARVRKRAHMQLRPVKPFDVRRFWRQFWARTRADPKIPWFIVGSTI